MATRTDKSAAEASDLGHCDNHPETAAVVMTDGGGKHEIIRLCKSCNDRWKAALNGRGRRG